MFKVIKSPNIWKLKIKYDFNLHGWVYLQTTITPTFT